VIVVDTHIVLWMAFEPSKLSSKARAAIAEARRSGGGLAICDVTLLELATAKARGRIHLETSLESFLSGVEARFVVLPITAQSSVRAAALAEDFPKDPADRIIAATALVEGASLITADANIRRSGAVPTIW
jgi:PIN domain nuclease of toxin-antitoxin system